MKRAAALYDIHGNGDALDAVLQDVEKLEPDRVLLGGDVAMGPFPAQTLGGVAEGTVVRRYVLEPPTADAVSERFESMARERAALGS